MIVGITGGIGCGKSAVAQLCEQRGFRRLDSDALVRERVLTAPEVVAAIRARFGEAVMEARGGAGEGEKERRGEGAEGGAGEANAARAPRLSLSPSLPLPAAAGTSVELPRVNRAALGERVFASEGERRWLEELTHPRVFSLWREAFAGAPDARWAVEVPLLFEQALENWFDFTVCVACAPERQLARLEQRGLPRVLAGLRITTQLPLARKIELADFVLWNDGSPEFLEAQVSRLIDTLAGRA